MGRYTKTKDTPASTDHQYATSSWVKHLSFGGLTEPTEEWLTQAKYLECIFKKYHKDYISKKPNIVKFITNKIKKRCSAVPEDVIHAFVLQRTYIRLKRINTFNKDKTATKRHLHQPQRSIVKKMKKMCN